MNKQGSYQNLDFGLGTAASFLAFPQLFAFQVARSPEATALIFGEERLTYAELDAHANALAHWLAMRQVGPGQIVAVALPRSFSAIQVMLAIMKCGAAYLPLDPDYPPGRIAYMLADARPLLLLTMRDNELPDDPGTTRVDLNDPDIAASMAGLAALSLPVSGSKWLPQQAAYVIYTSGSTGQPKGVVVAHGGMHALVNTYGERLRIEPGSRVLQFASLSFDASVGELCMSLALGAALVLAPPAELVPGRRLAELCARQRITHLALPPSLLALMAPGDLPTVQTLITGGEACPAELAAQWAARHRMVNCYGPTEATVDALISSPLLADAGMPVPIGDPVQSAASYILDASLKRVPKGEVGELYVAGPGLAQGYLHRPSLTAERFLADPWGAPGSRMYRTGDLVRQLADGQLCFVGRADQQIKLNGQRIELEEIEACLLREPGVAQAAVVAREDRAGRKQLVSYVVPQRVAGGAARDQAYEVQQVQQWQTLHDGLYSQHAELAHDEDFEGWNSSYDGQPIPLEQMREWRAATINRIVALPPARLLEIGVGTGLVLWKVAPHCESYWGTDFSLPVVESLRARVARDAGLRDRVQLRCKPAHELEELPRQFFDTIVLNSVIQYFPGANYLTEVLRQCLDLLAPGGRIFVGDVRNARLMRSFATAVAWHRAGGAAAEGLRQAIEEEIRLENELLIDPAYFAALPGQLADIAGIDIQLKPGRFHNELTRHRYEVVVHKRGAEVRSLVGLPSLAWSRDITTLEELRTHLATTRPDAVRLRHIPNARLTDEWEIMRQVWGGRDDADMPAIEPDDVHTLGIGLGYRVMTTWADDDAGRYFDAIFLGDDKASEIALCDLYQSSTQASTAPLYNDPGAMRDHRSFVDDLRRNLATQLPAYMVPAAFVVLPALPLTANGKLDHHALPAPAGAAFQHREYEPPQGEVERQLAMLWQELLGIEQVGRRDHFFELGGNSLIVIQLLERLHRLGLDVEVRALFDTPMLAELAASLGTRREIVVPSNAITPDCKAITPDMLPLIDLTQADIDCLLEQVPGGLGNIQDIYALAPLQEGMLFHHQLSTEGDPYLMIDRLAFADRGLLDRYLEAAQQVIDRHDILRTAFVWEGMSMPAQVVLRHAPAQVTELTLDPGEGDAHEQLATRFYRTHVQIDLTRAPLLHFVVAYDAEHGRWLLLQLLHHLIGDHSSIEAMYAEAIGIMGGSAPPAKSASPFRKLIAQARLGVPASEHETFFRARLADIDEPTLSFGVGDVYRSGEYVAESRQPLAQALDERLRAQARRLGVSVASLCHLAWGQVLARISGRRNVVFGTVLFGRMQTGQDVDSAMGLFINTLPLRLDIDGTAVETAVQYTHAQLAELLRHEHASLALAQRCSAVMPPTPLFGSLFNYLYEADDSLVAQKSTPGITWLGFEERTNYPLAMSVEDFGNALTLVVQAVAPISVERVGGYMRQALASLAHALEHAPEQPICQLEVLPQDERILLLDTWNSTKAPYPRHLCIHQLFEEQVRRNPSATAVVDAQRQLSYGALNEQANRLAHRLVELGVRPDDRVAICAERGVMMLVGLLAILKAGAGYVPLDPGYPAERLGDILHDAAPWALLHDAAGQHRLEGVAQPITCRVSLQQDAAWLDGPATPVAPVVAGLQSDHLAYVIHTSGSSGRPKGVAITHKALVNHMAWMQAAYPCTTDDRVLSRTSISFDASVWELWLPLISGGAVYLAPSQLKSDVEGLLAFCVQHQITVAQWVPSMLPALLSDPQRPSFRQVFSGGEALPAELAAQLVSQWQAPLVNLYGPTETTIQVASHGWSSREAGNGRTVPIGGPIANTRLYVLDANLQPVPIGAAGELYIAGEGLARGYLHRSALTAERFVANPFEHGGRMYRSGDRVRWREDGQLEYLGRTDLQIKIRGFRIEPGEVETALRAQPGVRQAAVVIREDIDSRPQLVGYVVRAGETAIDPAGLRAALGEHLPAYMVPTAIVELPAFPLTANGKLNARALPAPELRVSELRAPRNRQEQVLAELFAAQLGLPQVGIDDNFFELGGHSLLASRLISRIRNSLDVDVALQVFFDAPTVAGLATRLSESPRSTRMPLRPMRNRELPT